MNPGDHMGGSEKQNHKLEFRKVWAIIIIIITISNGSKTEWSTILEATRQVISNQLGAMLIWSYKHDCPTTVQKLFTCQLQNVRNSGIKNLI